MEEGYFKMDVLNSVANSARVFKHSKLLSYTIRQRTKQVELKTLYRIGILASALDAFYVYVKTT